MRERVRRRGEGEGRGEGKGRREGDEFNKGFALCGSQEATVVPVF